MVRYSVYPAMIVLLAGCGAQVAGPGAAPPGAVSRVQAVAAECRLLEEAQRRMVAASGRAPGDILTGCPGHESARDEMPLKAQTAALRRANAAQVPAVVRGLGLQGPRIYRRMITRGVPEGIAQQLAASDLMAEAARR
ncbi:hypothetical protein [Falsigemmobacter faecalis]|uniref:Uncharacterized protein n=1 Tax=Falsigemmobacter faecalis TaxID=2488730 RepID=A0A3P3DLI3_9RHOB|nr:hypothetical protein [Falsigemmobacter faecalis]RRH73478.1 hypothetical protein EG244_12390 [Falsigemmobacter faecalis]